MAKIDRNGTAIAFEDIGQGPPVVLVHGFASNRKRNWQEPRWFETLTGAGRRVVAVDCRGHGESDKPHDPRDYGIDLVAGDVLGVMDRLGIGRADLIGYSMGGRISAALLAHHGERFAAGVLGGVGGGLIGERLGFETIARALEADDASTVSGAEARAFRAFAEQGKNDLRALAACMRGLRSTVEAADLKKITAPVLVVVGSKDTLVGDPRKLVELIPDAQLVILPERDHLSAVGDRIHKVSVLTFLAQRGLPRP